MIRLDRINGIIRYLGGEEIDSQVLEFLEVEVLDILRWACYREDFPEEAEMAIEYLMAIKAILNSLEVGDIIDAKTPAAGRTPKSVTIENTSVEFGDTSEQDKKDLKRKGYKQKMNNLFNDKLEIFCSRYRCMKW